MLSQDEVISDFKTRLENDHEQNRLRTYSFGRKLLNSLIEVNERIKLFWTKKHVLKWLLNLGSDSKGKL